MSGLLNHLGTPINLSPFDGGTKPRDSRVSKTGGDGPAILTFAVPPEWMNVRVANKSGSSQDPSSSGDTNLTHNETPNCQRSRAWMGGEADQLWDMDLRDPSNREENDEYAANLCAGCPILIACLEAAMEEEGDASARGRYLVRGGLTPQARADIAIGERQCLRGHQGEMARSSRGDWRCRACNRDDSRAQYAEKVKDPTFRERRTEKQREIRKAKKEERAA